MITVLASVGSSSSPIQILNGRCEKSTLADVGGDDLGALVLGLIAEALHELLAGDLLGEARVVLDVGREHELPARDEPARVEALRCRGASGWRAPRRCRR